MLDQETTDLSPEGQILNAALTMIARHKFSGVRMRQIAEQAGISQGTLHYYFPTKADLLLALLDKMQQTFDEDRLTLFARGQLSAADKLGVFPTNQFRVLTDQANLEEVFLDFWGQGIIDPDIRQRIQQMYADWRQDIRQVIDEGVEEGAFSPGSHDLLPVVLVSLMEGVALQYLIENDICDLEAYFAFITDAVLDMLAYRPPAEPYPTDVSDDDWDRIAPLLPDARPGGRPRSTDLREVVNAILYVSQCGCTWRMLPHDFPNWQTVYGYFKRWSESGLLERIASELNLDSIRQVADA